MAVKSKKRRWSAEEKISVCLQTTVAGVSVAQVARRYAMNANLIFKWLRDERYASGCDAGSEDGGPVFLPVEIEVPDPTVSVAAIAPTGHIEIELSAGHRVTAEGSFDWDALARLLKGLAS